MMTANRFAARAEAGIAAALLLFTHQSSFAQPNERELVFIGSGHKNISAYWLELRSGALVQIGDVAQITAPSFFTVSPDEKLLFAVSEGRGPADSFISGFQIDHTTGGLNLINKELTGGAGPCHVSMDHKGANVFVANYNSGSLATFHIDSASGALAAMASFIQDKGYSIDKSRQEGPHAHSIVADVEDRFAYACDLGLDKVLIFRLDEATGRLIANEPSHAPVKAGSGPRHIAFHPNGQFAYVINEMGETVTVFSHSQATGALNFIEDLPLLALNFVGRSTGAEVAVHPSGKYVYCSNRGEDSITVFACEPLTGHLTYKERAFTGGSTPRNFEIDPTGTYLLAANQDSGTVVEFRIDPTGHLTKTGIKITSDSPMCVKCLNPVPSLTNPGQASLPVGASGAPAAPSSPVAPSAPAAPQSPQAPAAPQ